MNKDKLYNSNATHKTRSQDNNNLDYEFNTEYGDGDIPEIDTPMPSNATNVIPPEIPGNVGPDVRDK